MFIQRLVDTIERKAETISELLIADIRTNKYTGAYHDMAQETLRNRVIHVYKNLGTWLTEKTDENVRKRFIQLGAARYEEHIPVSQIVYALLLSRIHLLEYLQHHSLSDTAYELYREKELRHRVVRFFDKAVFYTVYGYEQAEDQAHQ